MRWLLPCYAAYRTSQTEFQTGSTRGRRRGAPSSENVGPSAAGPMQGSTLRAAGEFPTTTNLASESQSGNTSAFLVTYLVRLPDRRSPLCRPRTHSFALTASGTRCRRVQVAEVGKIRACISRISGATPSPRAVFVTSVRITVHHVVVEAAAVEGGKAE